jgi:hypothetical protein
VCLQRQPKNASKSKFRVSSNQIYQDENTLNGFPLRVEETKIETRLMTISSVVDDLVCMLHGSA